MTDPTPGRVRSWIVVIDRPYYPSVEQHDSERDAVAAYEKLLVTAPDLDGDNVVQVYMAEVVRQETIRTHY